jgi:hypothetical protein
MRCRTGCGKIAPALQPVLCSGPPSLVTARVERAGERTAPAVGFGQLTGNPIGARACGHTATTEARGGNAARSEIHTTAETRSCPDSHRFASYMEFPTGTGIVARLIANAAGLGCVVGGKGS